MSSPNTVLRHVPKSFYDEEFKTKIDVLRLSTPLPTLSEFNTNK